MSDATPVGASNKRIASLDGVKGFLSLKIAIAHVGFFVAVPWLSHLTGIGRMLSFPVLLFAFGVGTGISKRRKPAWPLVVLGLCLLAASVLNEAFLDSRLAHHFLMEEHPIGHGILHRLLLVSTLTQSAHYADFLQPYLLFLAIALVADRLNKPIRAWNPAVLMGSAFAMHIAGLALASLSYAGPLSVLWRDGYRSFQWAPLFAVGILVGAYRKELLFVKDRPKLQAACLFAACLVGAKLLEDGTSFLRPFVGSHGDLWKEGDIVANVGGLIAGILLFAAYSNLTILVKGPGMQAVERVGKRAIVSLCIQMIVLPLAGLVAVHFRQMPIRSAIGLGAWLGFAILVMNWERLIASLRKQGHSDEKYVVPEVRPSEAEQLAGAH